MEATLETREVELSKLKELPKNPREMSPEMRTKLSMNMTRLGYIDPIIWNEKTGHIIGGNQRLRLFQDVLTPEDKVTVVVVDIPEKDELAAAISLNKIQGEWDTNTLQDALKELNEVDKDLLEITGFEDKEVSELIDTLQGVELTPDETFEEVTAEDTGLIPVKIGYIKGHINADTFKLFEIIYKGAIDNGKVQSMQEFFEEAVHVLRGSFNGKAKAKKK